MDPVKYFLSFFPDASATMDELAGRLEYQFQSSSLLIEAMTHRSAIYELKHKVRNQGERELLDQVPWNEKLEFLGDSVLALCITTWLWYKSDLTTEGELSKARSALVQESVLALVACQLDLGDTLLMGEATARSGSRQNTAILANAVEALIGAVYLDGGFEVCYFLIERLFKSYIKQHLEQQVFADHKTRLQEILQQTYGAPPDYCVVEAKGPDHNKRYVVECRIQGKVLSRGEGKSKKKASQEAAAKALKDVV